MKKTVNLPKHRELINFYREALRAMPENPSPTEMVDIIVLRTIIDYMEETIRVAEEGDKPIVWFGACIMPEIFMAMDVHQYSPECLIGLLPGVQPEALKEYCLLAESAGLPAEMCVADRGTLGMLLAGILPHPDLFISTSLPCDNLVIGYQIYQNILQVPYLPLDAPYGNDEEDIEFYGNEMKRMVAFLEEHTGKKMDYDRLRELVEESNKAQEYWLELCELRKASPCPQPARLLVLCEFVNAMALGKPEGTAIYKNIRDDALEKVKSGKGVIDKERLRIAWFMLPLFFDLSIFDWMEQDLGATIPMDMFSYNRMEPIDTSTPDSMLKGLAQKSLNAPMARQLRGPTEFYTDDLVRVCEDYNCDAVVFAGHEGCKMAWGSLGLIRDTCKEIDKPLLVFDIDALLARPGQAAETRTKISEFINTIAPN